MVRWVRDISELSPKKQKIAGIVNTVLSIGLILLMDQEMHVPIRQSVFNICVMLLVSLAFMYGYAYYVNRRRKKLRAR